MKDVVRYLDGSTAFLWQEQLPEDGMVNVVVEKEDLNYYIHF